jgi:elongator complex protein 3
MGYTMSAASNACHWIVKQILDGRIHNRKELAKAKVEACKRFGIKTPLKNSDLLAAAGEARGVVVELLRLKPVRSISGVSVITVMPKPYPCPKSEPCIYCPGGPAFGTPQSYTGKEPAAARALQHNYDPYAQVKSRIAQLQAIGHEVDKVELVIFGGTLTAYPREYLEWFVAQCLNAMSGANATKIEDAQHSAENAAIRNSDIIIETRPDYCKEHHVDFMLRLGTTRVELGVQTIYDDVYEQINRGHTVEDVADATRIARDAGLAVVYHLMPGLPGSAPQRDLEMFRTIFEDERFRPDAIKIYPTLVMPGTKLYENWRRGEYEPYPFERLLDLMAEIKKLVPQWVRVQRVQRDIPLNLIAAGVERGDMRALVQRRLELEGARCRCIRCREVGHVMRRCGLEPDLEDVKLEVKRYRASEGVELFLSFEDVKRDILIGLLRLREPSLKAHRPETKTRSMLVRELHVYGPLLKVGEKAGAGEWQHRGWGERLIREAERISREEFDACKVIVLSGIGTRNYYRRFGYEREGPYMVKILK